MATELEELKSRLPEFKTVSPEPTIGPDPIIPEPISPAPTAPLELTPTEPAVPLSSPEVTATQPSELDSLKERLPEQTIGEQLEESVVDVAEEAVDVGQETLKTAYDRLMGVDVSDPVELERLIFSSYYGLTGGELGAKVPGPPWLKAITTLAGGIAGVAGGSSVPEAYWNAVETLGIVPPGTAKQKALSKEELLQLIKGEVLLELVTLGGVSALRTGGRLTAQLFTGMTKEGRRIAEGSAKLGINLMPVQVGDRVLGKGFVSVVGRFPLIGKPIYKRGLATEKAFAKEVENMPERIAPLFIQSDLGMQIYREGKNLLKSMNDYFDENYRYLFARAEAAGVGVRPEHTLAEAHKIKEEMLKRSPTGVSEALGLQEKQLDELYQGYSDFLDKNIFKMEETRPGGDYIRREQTFREMDGIAGMLDRYALTLEGGKKRAIQYFNKRLKDAALFDMKTNAFGRNADVFQNEMATLDRQFSNTMKQYFETSTAKRFARVRRRGLRAIEFDEWTTQNVDQLARFVVDTKSPEALKDLRKIVMPSTWRSIKASILYDALRKPLHALQVPEGHFKFDALAFERAIGFDSKTSPLRKTFEELFEKGNVTTKDLESFLAVGKKISGLEIPNVSDFVARRAVLGGRSAIWGAFFVGAAGSASAGYEQGGFWGLAMNTIMFAGGARLLAATLSNPMTARPFMKVLNSEASLAHKRAVLARIIRLGLESTGYGIEGIQEKTGDLYKRAYPEELGEGKISKPVGDYFERIFPSPGLTEEQIQKSSEYRQKREIDIVLKYANAYVDFGLGKEPVEFSEASQYEPYVPKPVYHTGGQVRDFSSLSTNLDKMPDVQREKHLRNLYQKDQKTFNRLLDYLENR
jgi:hypothetical protein